MPEITYQIDDQTGEMTMTIKGIEGPACDDIRKLAAQLLGEASEDLKTPEFYMQATATPRVRQ